MVAQDEDACLLDLHRQVAIAEMPGEFHEVQAVLRRHFVERLVGGDHLDRFASLRQEKITVGELHGLLAVDHDHIVMLHVQELAAHMALVVYEHDDVDGRAACAAVIRQDFR